MLHEAGLLQKTLTVPCTSPPVQEEQWRSPSLPSNRSATVDAPIFEAVRFAEDAVPALGTPAPACAQHIENQAAPPTLIASGPLQCGTTFVMTARGSSLGPCKQGYCRAARLPSAP
jgi:hypothetical protein